MITRKLASITALLLVGVCCALGETAIHQRDTFLKECAPADIKVATSMDDPGVDDTTRVVIFKKVAVDGLPAWLLRCPNIEMLRFLGGSTAFSQETAETISKLKRLRFLLFDSTVTETPKDWSGLAALENLQVLSLTNAGLSFVPDGIGEMKNVRSLYLNMNRLTGLPAGLAKLTGLRELSLSDNQITSLSGVMADLNVEDLDLSGNDLSAVSGKQLPRRLKTLSLSRNKMGQFLAGVDSMKFLEELFLNDNYFDEAPAELLQCQRLKRVHLSRYVRVPKFSGTSKQLEIVKLDP